jgi:hypothetical protein
MLKIICEQMPGETFNFQLHQPEPSAEFRLIFGELIYGGWPKASP